MTTRKYTCGNCPSYKLCCDAARGGRSALAEACEKGVSLIATEELKAKRSIESVHNELRKNA